MKYEELKENSHFYLTQMVNSINDEILKIKVNDYINKQYYYPMCRFLSSIIDDLSKNVTNPKILYICKLYEAMFCVCEIRRLTSIGKLFQKEQNYLSPKQISTLTFSVNQIIFTDILSNNNTIPDDISLRIGQIFLETYGIEGRIKAEELELKQILEYLENNSEYPDDILSLSSLMEGNIYLSLIKSIELCDNSFIFIKGKDKIEQICSLIAEKQYLHLMTDFVFDKDKERIHKNYNKLTDELNKHLNLN